MKARDNPFATDRVLRLRYRLIDWPVFLERLAALNYHGAIVGPEGAGKTTLLEDLALPLEERGFVVLQLFLNRDTPRAARSLAASLRESLTARTIVLLDGAEQLSGWQWYRLRKITRRAAGLVITSHRPSMLVTLRECSTSPELLASLMRELVGDEAASYASRGRVLFSQHNGNLRDVLRAFYDDAAAA